MNPIRVLGVDPGFASIGYAVFEVYRDSERVVDAGLIATTKSDAKRKVRASEDNLERAKEIFSALDGLAERWGVTAVCAETMSFPRNSAAAAKMAMCWGVLAAIVQKRGLALAQASPQEVKKASCGKKDASKEEVPTSVGSRYPEIQNCVKGVAPSRREHPYDAAATVVACLGSEVLLLARKVAPSCEVSTASSSRAT